MEENHDAKIDERYNNEDFANEKTPCHVLYEYPYWGRYGIDYNEKADKNKSIDSIISSH